MRRRPWQKTAPASALHWVRDLPLAQDRMGLALLAGLATVLIAGVDAIAWPGMQHRTDIALDASRPEDRSSPDPRVKVEAPR